MDELQRKWDERYRGATQDPPSAANVLRDNAHLLPATGRALDLACGRGGNALFLAARGLVVDAWDLSPVAVDQLAVLAHGITPPINATVRDVLVQPPSAGSYDIITVSYFLERDLATALTQALRPGGLLFYQTFGPERLHDKGPRTPAYRLETCELLRLFSALRVRFYREDGLVGDMELGLRGEVMFVGERL